MNRLFSIRYHALVFSMLLAFIISTQFAAAASFTEIYNPRFWGQISAGSYTAPTLTLSTVAGGVYTNVGITNTFGYRIYGTNSLGRTPVSAQTNITFAESTGSVAVAISWGRVDGVSGYVLEKSYDGGTSWTNHFHYGATVTNATDWQYSSFSDGSNSATEITAFALPWLTNGSPGTWTNLSDYNNDIPGNSTNLSELNNDIGFLTNEPIFLASVAYGIIAADTSRWNTAATDASAATGSIATIQASTSLWDTAAVDASSATSAIAVINASTGVWTKAASDAITATNAIPRIAELEGHTNVWNTGASDASTATNETAILRGATNALDAVASGLTARTNYWNVAVTGATLAAGGADAATVSSGNLALTWNTNAIPAYDDSALRAATNALDSNKLDLSGGEMTGLLTNKVGFVGNGAGLTNLSVGSIDLSTWSTNAASHRVYWTNVVYDAISIGSTGALNPNVSGIYVSAYSAPDFDYSSTSVVYECTNGYMLTAGRFIGTKTYRISAIGSEIPYIYISGSENPDCLYVQVDETSTGAPTGTWVKITNVCTVSIGPDALVSDMLTISNKIAVAGIKLGTNPVITNWPSSGISDLPITNDLMNATNSLNTRLGAVEIVTGTLDTAVGDLRLATNAFNSALSASSSRWDQGAADGANATNMVRVASNALISANAAVRTELTNSLAVTSNAAVSATTALRTDVTNRIAIVSNMVDVLNTATGVLDTIARDALPASSTNALDIQALQIRGTSPTNGAVWVATNAFGEGAWATHRSKVYSLDTQTTNVVSKTIDIGFRPIAIFATACRYSMTQYSWALCDRNGSCVGMANADLSPGMLYPITVLAFIGWGSGSWSIPAPTILSNGISFSPSVSGTALTVNTNVNVRFLFLE